MKAKVTLTTLLVILATLPAVFSQTGVSTSPSAEGDAALKQQLAELQTKVKQLEAALASRSRATSGAPTTGMSAGGGMQMGRMTAGGGMNMRGGMAEMNQMTGMQAGGGMNMPGMQAGGGTGMMGMMGDMGMMDQMMSGMTAGGGMSMEGEMMNMAPHSALPGFPGASHIYHIGATGFFLDHAQHINLSTDQQVQLNKIKEQALLSKSGTDRQIEQAEQELAVLTSSDQPDLKKIDTKVREISKLGTEERVAFIKGVGEAAKVLTDDQRKILTGFATPAPSPAMSPMGHM